MRLQSESQVLEKKAFSSELIFARSDVSQLKQIPGKGTAEAIFANAKYKFIFKHN